jgi:hypothetical protein
MRTRTGWLAMLLTAGVALSPMMARAQDPVEPGKGDPRLIFAPYIARAQVGGVPLDYDVPRADPVWPLPLYHDRPDTGGFYAGAETMFWRQSNPLRHQLIAVRGLVDFDGSIHQDITIGTVVPGFNPITQINGRQTLGNDPFIANGIPLPGGFIGSGRAALFADDAGGPGTYVPGWNINLGYRFREGFSVELSNTHLFGARYQGGATLVPQGMQTGVLLEDSFLYSPVFNFPTTYAGPQQKLALGNPLAAFGIWNGASEMTVRFEQHYDEWKIGGRVPICENECSRCYGLVGLQRVWLWEIFKWRTVSFDFAGLADASDVATYNNTISNVMYGPYIGCGDECYLGHGFSVSLDLRASAMIDFVHEEVKWIRGDFATEAKRTRREYAITPELDALLSLWWYPIEGVQLRLGYDVKAFFNTKASPDPVSFNFNGLDPEWKNEAVRFVDGFRFGIAFIF